jgi:hypothetical protein
MQCNQVPTKWARIPVKGRQACHKVKKRKCAYDGSEFASISMPVRRLMSDMSCWYS